MNTPICDFVEKYIDIGYARFHMPGHKGKCFLGIEKYDITEIDGADVLYSENGIIKESENNAKELFDSGKTLYSCEGSSLCVRAMLYLSLLHSQKSGRTPKICAFRNVHRSFLSACVLLNIEPCFIYPQDNIQSIISCNISPIELEKHLSKMQELPTALYVTSPDYLGNMLDIEGISRVCKKHSILLLVDNAHGAYLKFLPESLHPITLGADMCCDSAHKTLPVLTGGAYLHISKTADRILFENVQRALSLFASTSPSYLILQSLDMANKYINNSYKKLLQKTCKKTQALKSTLTQHGFTLVGSEPLKITIKTKPYGYEGKAFSSILLKKNIVSEFYDKDFVVFMISPENIEQLDSLEKALISIPKKTAITESMPKISVPQRKISLREAMFSKSEKIKVSKSLGRTLCEFSFSCPPAIPIAILGEVIDQDVINLLEYYDIDDCNVVIE